MPIDGEIVNGMRVVLDEGSPTGRWHSATYYLVDTWKVFDTKRPDNIRCINEAASRTGRNFCAFYRLSRLWGLDLWLLIVIDAEL